MFLELLLRNPLFFLIFAVRVSQKFCRATVGEVRHIQNDLRLFGEDFVQRLFQLRFHNRHSMAGGGLIHLAVPTQEVVVFVRRPGHSVAAAATEHFVPQGVGIGVLLRCLEPGPLGLHLIE